MAGHGGFEQVAGVGGHEFGTIGVGDGADFGVAGEGDLLFGVVVVDFGDEIEGEVFDVAGVGEEMAETSREAGADFCEVI